MGAFVGECQKIQSKYATILKLAEIRICVCNIQNEKAQQALCRTSYEPTGSVTAV